MAYVMLTEDEQNDILASYLLAQERDHFVHSINRERFVEMLKDLSPQHPFRERIQKLLTDTDSRLFEVGQILENTHKQIASRDQTKFSESIKRIKAKKPMGT